MTLFPFPIFYFKNDKVLASEPPEVQADEATF